jgi:hypothetical protein
MVFPVGERINRGSKGKGSSLRIVGKERQTQPLACEDSRRRKADAACDIIFSAYEK